VAGFPAELAAQHQARFGAAEFRAYRAPGRINLMGDHTDYNEGFVLPMAIGQACFVAASPNPSDVLRVQALDVQGFVEMPVAALDTVKRRGDWSDYVTGVARELHLQGVPLAGTDCTIASTIPLGAGLSSSAALEVATALALLGPARLDPLELAQLCRRAENRFVENPCGIMDQYACVFGRAGEALQLDCRTLESQMVPLPPEMTVVAVNSMIKHELGTSEYRVRVRECQEAARALGVASLRDVTRAGLEARRDVPAWNRAHHVVSENQRVLDAAQAARQGDAARFGQYAGESHESLRRDYEVSCPEVDFLVETAGALPGVFGARMTGGGFGGCIVAFVERDRVDEVGARVRARYQERFGRTAEVFACQAAAGAGPCEW
jgi:galactokinase